MLKETRKWLWGTRTGCPHCGGVLPVLRSLESPQTIGGFVCPGCGSTLMRRVPMEPREALYSLCLCGGLALAVAAHAHVLGGMVAGLATVLLLRSQFTCRLVVGDRIEEFPDEDDAGMNGGAHSGPRREPLGAARRVRPPGVVAAYRRRH